ncbi:MAG: hypothetical protein ACXV2I_13395 [Actinomycetes bacterium]
MVGTLPPLGSAGPLDVAGGVVVGTVAVPLGVVVRTDEGGVVLEPVVCVGVVVAGSVVDGRVVVRTGALLAGAVGCGAPPPAVPAEVSGRT